jgi:hypothetical protein
MMTKELQKLEEGSDAYAIQRTNKKRERGEGISRS